MCYSIEPKTSKYVEGYGFLSFGKHLSSKYRKQLLGNAKKTGITILQRMTKKVAHKAAEATG